MLKLNHISKTFNAGTVNEKKALSDISLHLKKGEFVTVIGSNGAGKSTLLNAISGSFGIDSGSIELDGKDITHTKDFVRAASIGRLFQNPMQGTAPAMSIEDNLFLASGRSGWLGRISERDRKDFREMLAVLGMGLEDRMKSPVGLLSGGQRQALSLLMATYHTPKLLLLDEHTAALDPAAAEKILELTEKIVSENRITCLMITHDMDSALHLGSRTIMMNGGKIIHDLSGAEREKATTGTLISLFKEETCGAVVSDRMLLS